MYHLLLGHSTINRPSFPVFAIVNNPQWTFLQIYTSLSALILRIGFCKWVNLELMEDQAREVNRGNSGGPPAGDRKLDSNSSVARTGWAALHWHNHIHSCCCLQPLCCWILSKNCPLPACNKSLQNLASNNESPLISLGVCWGGIWEELSWAFLVWDLSHGCCCVLAGLPSSEVWTGLKYPLPGWLTLLANKLVVGWGP